MSHISDLMRAVTTPAHLQTAEPIEQVFVQRAGSRGLSPDTRTRCPHCRHDTESGTHNGCADCGMVKHTLNGRRIQ